MGLFSGIGKIVDPIDALHGFKNPNPLADPLDLFGAQGRDAANNAAGAQLQASREQIAFLQQLFNAQQGNNAYGQGIGNQALGQLGSLYGLTPGQNPGGSYTFVDGKLQFTPGNALAGTAAGGARPDFSSFYQSPDYTVARNEALSGTNALAGKLGNLFSGSRATALQDNASKIGSQYFNQYANRLAGMAGIGQTATQNTNNALSGIGGQIGDSLLGQGDSRASGYLGGYQARQQGMGNALQLGGLIGSFFCDRRLKTEVEFVGMNGPYKWYRFRYLWGDKGEGPMADEVRTINPAAVREGPGGFLMVNAGAL
jgi:hypothetical protein